LLRPQALVEELKSEGVKGTDLCAVRMDVMDVDSIRAALDQVTKMQSRLCEPLITLRSI
jgi:hypothetical protein